MPSPLEPIANAAEYSGCVALLIGIDHAVPDEPLHCFIGKPGRIAGLDHWPWLAAIFWLQQPAGDRLLDTAFGHRDCHKPQAVAAVARR